jgi:hypothetical protein
MTPVTKDRLPRREVVRIDRAARGEITRATCIAAEEQMARALLRQAEASLGGLARSARQGAVDSAAVAAILRGDAAPDVRARAIALAEKYDAAAVWWTDQAGFMTDDAEYAQALHEAECARVTGSLLRGAAPAAVEVAS